MLIIKLINDNSNMKFIGTLLILILSVNMFSQDMKLKNKDKKTNIELIRSGKFIQEIKHPKASPGYFMVIKDSFRYDYSDNGSHFTKSKIKFIKPDLIESIAYETTKPNFECHLHEVVETKILQTSTQDSIIRIKERINKGKWHNFVLRKVKN